MVLLLLYQMTKRIINQWNNWIIITIICEPPWTVCDEAEPCNFLLFEVTICHDPVYHAHTSCHLMTPGYCLTSVRQSAAPQQHWRPLWLLIRYWYSPHHHHGPVTEHLANQISLSVSWRSRDCLWFYLIFCSWWYVSHAVSNVQFRFSYFGNWTLIIKPKMARWGVGASWREQQWPSIWFLNLVRQSGGWRPAT